MYVFTDAPGDASASPDSNQQPLSATLDDAQSSEEKRSQQQPRRLFLEFFGPVVGFFLWLGFSNRGAELMTVAATQLCPLIAAAPLLRLSTRAVDGSGSAGVCLWRWGADVGMGVYVGRCACLRACVCVCIPLFVCVCVWSCVCLFVFPRVRSIFKDVWVLFRASLGAMTHCSSCVTWFVYRIILLATMITMIYDERPLWLVAYRENI